MANNIYFYKGDEKFLTSSKIQRLIKETKADELNITSYDCSEVNVEKAIFDALTPAFLGNKKVVIIKNPVFIESEKASSSHNIKLLIQYLEKPWEETVLIINGSGLKINEKLEVVKALNKYANIITTNGISEVEFSGWLQRECELQGVKIEKNAIALFYKTSGNDLEQTQNEISKVINYVGKNGLITEAITKELISKNSQNDIFTLTNALCEQNKKKVFEVYLELTRYEKDVSVLINMISKTLRDNLLVKMLVKEGYEQAQVASKMKVSPNRAYYMIKNANMFSVDVIKKYINNIALLDYNIKSGKVDKRIGFEEFLLR